MESFRDPPVASRARFRWWWPHGLVEEEQIRSEVAELAKAGFGGAEIADVHHSIREPLSPDTHGWGTKPWVAAVKAALEEAQTHGLSMDLTLGPSWPVALPTLTPNSEAAMQELATGTVLIPGGQRFLGAIPKPDVEAHWEGTEEKLILVQAAQLSPQANSEDEELELVQASVQTLSIDAGTTQIDWTAPEDGRWVIIAYWLRGSGQRPERGPHTVPPSFVVDHYSNRGAQAVIEFWETRILDDELRALLRSVGGAFFEDSIEMETDVTLWTPGLLEIFEKRKGYSLLPYLPLIVQEDEDPIFRYAGFDSGFVEHDWWDLISRLFIEEHLRPLQEWAHGYDMQLRAQPYGLPTDAVTAAAVLDIAEGESLGFKNLDDYRSLAGGRDMGGHRLLSNEAGAFAGGAYSTTWPRMLKTLNPIFTAGVNQTVLHGFSYGGDVPGTTWPGFAAFSPYGGTPGYAGSWGPRQPSWKHISEIADYFGRIQWILQTGTPRVDVAFLRQKGYAGSGFGAPWLSKEGNARGWSHRFISPETLNLSSAVVHNGRLAPDGPAFRVLVFEGDAFHGRQSTMPLETAERIVELAEAGLPVLAVGDWSAPMPSGLAQDGEPERLKTIFAQLLSLPNVANVPDRQAIPDGLDRLGLSPAVAHEPATLTHETRAAGPVKLFVYANTGTQAVSTTVSIESHDPEVWPYVLDTWTGEVRPVAHFNHAGGRVFVPLALEAGATASLALAPADWAGYRLDPSRQVLSITNGQASIDSDGQLRLRAFKTGQAVVRLGNGEAVNSVISGIPEFPSQITVLDLTVASWIPGETPTSIQRESRVLKDFTLRPWTADPLLQDLSGTALYHGFIDLPDWDRQAGAVLEVGEVFNTLRVRVNGHEMPPIDPLSRAVDLGRLLKKGRNKIEIEVTTTLNNQLRVAVPDVFSINSRQPYGLPGPLQIRPYREIILP